LREPNSKGESAQAIDTAVKTEPHRFLGLLQ